MIYVLWAIYIEKISYGYNWTMTEIDIIKFAEYTYVSDLVFKQHTFFKQKINHRGSKFRY